MIFNIDDLLNRALKVQVVGRGEYFDDYTKAFCSALNLKNIEAFQVEYIDYSEEWDVVFIISPNIKMKKEISRINRKNKVICALLTEQPYSREIGFLMTGRGMVNREKAMLKYYDLVFVWSKEQRQIYSQYHSRVIYFPHSYYKALDYTREFHGREKKYDILFLGAGFPEHRRILMDKLREKYVVLDTATPDEVLWGKEKYKAISETRICLNIHQEPGLVMESPRLYDYFANKAFVLSESMKWSDPFKDGKDYITYYYSDIMEKIEFYLEHTDERDRIAENAYLTVKTMSMERTINIIIDAILMEMNYKWNKKNNYRNNLRLLKKVIICKLKEVKNSLIRG